MEQKTGEAEAQCYLDVKRGQKEETLSGMRIADLFSRIPPIGDKLPKSPPANDNAEPMAKEPAPFEK